MVAARAPSRPPRTQWALLAYRLPREPSTPRITVWRKLRRLGSVQIVDGLVALPLDARTKEQLEWVADEIREASGEAALWLAHTATARAEQELAARMAAEIAAEYGAVVEEAGAVRSEDDPTRRRVTARLRRQLHRIGQRDFFPPPERDRAHRAVAALAALEPVAV